MRKWSNNSLITDVLQVIELIHPEMSSVSKKDIKAKLSQTMKTKDENISIFGLKTKFGGGRSTGFALIYDTLDARKKFDTKKMLRRVSNLDTLGPQQPGPSRLVRLARLQIFFANLSP